MVSNVSTVNRYSDWDVIECPRPKKIRSDRRLFIFGLGGFAKACERSLKNVGCDVHGFIVTSKITDTFNETKVFSLEEFVGKDTQVVVGVFNREHPYNAISQALLAKECSHILYPWDIYDALKCDLGWRYWLSDPNFLYQNIKNLKRINSVLGDTLSRLIFLNTVKFRMGLYLEHSAFKSKEPQYFNRLTLDNLDISAVNFVDGGAFDGDTYLALTTLCNVSKAYLFEPDIANFTTMKRNVRNVQAHKSLMPLALSNKYQVLAFSGDGEDFHMNSSSGEVKVAAAALDDVLGNVQVDLLKLDIEGGEADALRGASTIIRESAPIVMVSAYHRPEDLWVLPSLLLSISPNYKLYFRQHCYNSFDLVLYAIPVHR